MVHLSLEPETMDKLAANACLHGRSLGDEIKARIEASFKPERAEPREWR
jgi:plasmid stability protein